MVTHLTKRFEKPTVSVSLSGVLQGVVGQAKVKAVTLSTEALPLAFPERLKILCTVEGACRHSCYTCLTADIALLSNGVMSYFGKVVGKLCKVVVPRGEEKGEEQGD